MQLYCQILIGRLDRVAASIFLYVNKRHIQCWFTREKRIMRIMKCQDLAATLAPTVVSTLSVA